MGLPALLCGRLGLAVAEDSSHRSRFQGELPGSAVALVQQRAQYLLQGLLDSVCAQRLPERFPSASPNARHGTCSLEYHEAASHALYAANVPVKQRYKYCEKY